MVEPTQSLGEIDLKNSTASELGDADLASRTMNGDLLMQCSDGGPSSLLGAGPPSPLTGCYLMIVIGEPHSDEHKDIILQKLLKGFLSWDSSDCQVDLEEELNTITLHAPEGEEARHGERLIQYASENLVTEILIHPQYNTLIQCMRNLLSSFTRHRHIIHAGYTFAGNGSWILQDGTFSVSDFSEAFQENDVQRVLRAYPDTITMDIHCESVGLWSALPDKNFAKSCRIRINPNDVLNSGSDKINSFIDYVGPMIMPASLTELLESSDVVGNIRFSHPTLYVFPGGQGDAALFGINGFNMLVDGGFGRKACFWDFTRHLDRLDAVLMTRINNCNIDGLGAVVERKRGAHVYPQIGHFFCNIPERKGSLSPDGGKDNKDPLLIDLFEKGSHLVNNLRAQNLAPQTCYQDSEPINLYHKVGHGTLDMYVLSPSRDAKDVKEFLQKWNSNDSKLFQPKDTKEFMFPIQNLISICALLVWLPANPDDSITRILFPGSTPDYKIIEGLEKIKHLEFMKNPVCTTKSIAPSISSSTLSKKSIKSVTGGDKAADLIIPQRPMKTVERDNKTLDNKLKDDVAEKKKVVTKQKPSEPIKKVEKIDNKVTESEKIEEPIKRVVKDKEPEEKEDKEKTIDESEAKTEIETKDEEEKDSGKEKLVGPDIKEDLTKEGSVDKDETDVIKPTTSQSAAGVPAPGKTKPTSEPKSAKKSDSKPIKSRIDTRPPRSMAAQRQTTKKEEKKEIAKASPTTTPKKTAPQPKETKEIKSKVASRFLRSSPSSTPAKSAKDANNRKVLESKQRIAAAKKETTPKPAEKKEPTAKPERKPISRRAKAESPSRRPQGSPVKSARPARTKAEKDKGKLEKGGTTDSSLVSTPSADDAAIVKKVIVPTLKTKSPTESTTDAPAIVDDSKEEQECIREIEAVFSRDQGKVVKTDVITDRREVVETSKQDSTTEVEEDEEYLIIEKEEVEQYTEDSINEQESLTKEEEIQKHQRDSEESEKKRKSSVEEAQDENPLVKEKAKVVEIIEGVDADKDVISEKKDNEPEDDDMQPDSIEEDKIPNKEQIKEEVQEIITSAKEIAKTRTESRDEIAIKTEEFSTPSIDEKISSNKRTSEETNDDKGDEQIIERQQQVEQSQPDEKFSATAESGATTAPTLPEDERIPLDEIKEVLDVVEEKYVKEETKERESPMEAVQIKKQGAHQQYSMPPPPTYEPLERQQIPTQIKFDMQQSHLRDIVKTPDEVADLPVHEEVDYVVGYDDYHHPPTTAAPSVPSTGKIIDKKTDYDHDKKTEKEILRDVEDIIIPAENFAKKSQPVKSAEIVPRFSECKDQKELAEKVAEFDKIIPTKVEILPVHEEATSVFTALKDEMTDSIATAIDLTKEKIQDKIENITTAKTVKEEIVDEISKTVDATEKVKTDLEKNIETTVNDIIEDMAKTTEAVIENDEQLVGHNVKETKDIVKSTVSVNEKLVEEARVDEATINADLAPTVEKTKDTIEVVKDNISNITKDIKEYVASKEDNIESAKEEILNITKDVQEAIVAKEKHISDDIKSVIVDAKDKLIDEINEVEDEVKQKVGSVEETVVEIKKDIVGELHDVKDETKEKLDEASEKTKDTKDNIIGDIKGTKEKVGAKINVNSDSILEDASKMVNNAKDAIVNAKDSLVESILEITGKTSPVADKIPEIVKDAVDETKEKVEEITIEGKDSVKDIEVDTKDKLVDDIKDLKDELVDTTKDLAEKTTDEAKSVTDDIVEVVEDIKEKTGKKVEEVVEVVEEKESSIRDAFEGITNSILDFKDKLFNDVKDSKPDIEIDVSKVTKKELLKDFTEHKVEENDLLAKTSENVKSVVADLEQKPKVSDTKAEIIDNVVDVKEVSKVKVDLGHSISEAKVQLVEDFTEIKDEIKDDIKTATQKLIDEAKEIQTDVQNEVETKANEAIEIMSEKRDWLKEKMEDVNDLSAKLDDIKAKTASFVDDLKLDIAESNLTFPDGVTNIQDDIDDGKYEIKEEVLEKADSLKEQITEKATALKLEANHIYDKVIGSATELLTDTQNEITTKLENNQQKIMDQIVDESNETGTQLEDKFESIDSIDIKLQLDHKIEEQVSKIDDTKLDIINDISDMQKYVDELKEEIIEEIIAVKLEASKVDKVKEVKNEVVSKVESSAITTIDLAKDIIDATTYDQISKVTNDITDKIDDLEKDFKEKASEISVEKKLDTSTKIPEAIKATVDKNEDVSAKTGDIIGELKDVIYDTVEDTKKTEDLLKDDKSTIIDEVTHIKEETNDEFVKLTSKVEPVIETVTEESKTFDNVEDKLSNFKDKFEETKQAAAAEVDKVIDKATAKIEDTKDKTVTEVSNVIDKVNASVEATKENIDTVVSKVTDKVEETNEMIVSDVNTVTNNVEKSIEESKDEVTNVVPKVVDKVEKTVKDTKNEVITEISKATDTVEDTVEDIKEKIDLSLSKTTEKVETAVIDILNKADSEALKVADKVETKAQDAKAKVDDTNKSIDDTKFKVGVETSLILEAAEVAQDAMASKIEGAKDEVTKVADSVGQTSEDIVHTIDDAIETAGDKIEKTKETASEKIVATASETVDKLDDIKVNIAAEVTKVSDTVKDNIEISKDKVEETIKTVGDKVEDTKEMVKEKIASVVDMAATKVEDTTYKIASDLEKTADTVEVSKEKFIAEVAKTVESATTTIESTKEKAENEVSNATDTIGSVVDNTKENMATAHDSVAAKIDDTKEKASAEISKAVDIVEQQFKATTDKIEETKSKASEEVVKAIDRVDNVVKSADIKIDEAKEKVASEVAKVVDATSTKVEETKQNVATEVAKAVDATSSKIEQTKDKIETKIDATKETVDKELTKASETIEKSIDSAKEKIDSVKEEIQEKTKSGISSFFGGISQGIKSGFEKLTEKSEDSVKEAPKEEIELAKKPSPPTFEMKAFPTELRETHITTLDSPINDQTERAGELKTLEKLAEQTEEEMEEMKPSMTFQVEEIRYTSPSFDREDSSLNDIKEEEEEDHFSPPRKTSDSDKFSRSVSPRTQEDVIKIVANVAEVLKSDKDLEEIIPDFDPEELEKKLSARASPVPLHLSSSPEEDIDDENGSKTVQRMLVTASSEDGGGEIEICPQGSIIFDGAVSGTATPDLRSGRHSPEELQTEEKSDQPKDTTIAAELENEIRQIADCKEDQNVESSSSKKPTPDESKADKSPQSSGKSTPELKTSPCSIDEKEKHEVPEKMQKSDDNSKSVPQITTIPPEKNEIAIIDHEARKESVASEYINDVLDSRRESAISSLSEKDYTKEESSIGIDDKDLSTISHASDKSIEEIRDEVEKITTKDLTFEKDEIDGNFEKPGDTSEPVDIIKAETLLKDEIKTKEQVSQEVVSKEETQSMDITDDGVDEVDKLKESKVDIAIKTPEISTSPIASIKTEIADTKLETLEFLQKEIVLSRPDSVASQISEKSETRPLSAASEKPATDKLHSRPDSDITVDPKPQHLNDKKSSSIKSESSPESVVSLIGEISKHDSPRPISAASHTSDLGSDKEQFSRPESRASDKSRPLSVLSDHFDDEILTAMVPTKAVMKETRSKSVASIMIGSMYKEHDDLKPLSALEEVHEYSKDDTDMLPKFLASSKTSIASLSTEKIEKLPAKKISEPSAEPKKIDMSKSVLDDIWGEVPPQKTAKPSSSKTSPSEHHESISLSGKSTPDIADVIEDKISPDTLKESTAFESGHKTPPTVPVSPIIKSDIMTQSMMQMTGSSAVTESDIHSGKSSPGLIQTSSESASKSTSVGQCSGVDTTDSSPKPTSPFPKGIQTIKDEVKTSSGMSTPDMTRMSTPDIMDTKYLDKSEAGSDSVTTVTTTTITPKTADTSVTSAVVDKSDKVEGTAVSLKSSFTATQPISKEVSILKTSEMRSFTPGMEDYDPHDVSSPRSDISSGQASRVIPGWTPGSSEERHIYSDDEVPSSPMSVTSHAAHSPPSKFAYEDPYDLQRSSSGVSKKSDLDIDDSQDDIPPQYGSEELKSAISISSSYRPDPMSTSFYGALPDMASTGKSEPIPIAKSRLSAKAHLMEFTSSGPSEDSMTSSFSGNSSGLPGGIDHKFLEEADLDFEKALEQHRQVRGADVMSSITSKYEYSPTRHVIDATSDSSKVPELPKKSGESTTVIPTTIQSSTSSSSSSSLTQSSSQQSQSASQPPELTKDKEEFIASWGKPLGLPAPAPIPVENNTTPKKDTVMQQRRMVVNSKTKLNNEKNLRKRSESPVKGNKKNSPIYMDLTYVPHHGNSYYSHVEFFKRVRARYYVFSGTEPSREVYNALLEAKQTWEDKDLEVTIIPTYDTDVLGYWVSENEDLLAKYHIDLSPSASRCTINLQDHETSCSAYRLEF